MGTRNLTCVYSEGSHRIAQYGQWDGYPGGQGLTVLRFCRDHLSSAAGLYDFRQRLRQVRFVDDAEARRLWEAAIPPEPDLRGQPYDVISRAHDDHKRLISERLPGLTRDTAAGILGKVMGLAPGSELVTQDSLDFAAEGLFCEWAYVIDLDQGLLEGYRGLGRAPAGGRFVAMVPDRDTGYGPVGLAGSWPLSALPSDDDFVSGLEPRDED